MALFENSWFFAFGINFILIFLAQRLPLLTSKGWIHAGALGTILWGCLGWRGWLAVFFYLLFGYLVTKIGFAYKKSLGVAEGRDGLRGPENVWGSAATGAFLAILVDLVAISSKEIFLVGFAASFAAKLADTFGSEVGKRWGKSTFLITSLKKVPVGTDGAISLQGTLASLGGSVLMTYVMYSLSLIDSSSSFLIVVSSGFFATLIESVIGATFQNRVSWLSNELVNAIQTTFSATVAMILFLFFRV